MRLVLSLLGAFLLSCPAIYVGYGNVSVTSDSLRIGSLLFLFAISIPWNIAIFILAPFFLPLIGDYLPEPGRTGAGWAAFANRLWLSLMIGAFINGFILTYFLWVPWLQRTMADRKRGAARLLQRATSPTLERTTRRASYLALGLATLSLCIVAVGWALSFQPGLRGFRLIGFSVGGMASIATSILCVYYQRYRQLRSPAIAVATVISSLYGIFFVGVVAALFIQHPIAAKWPANAF